MVIKIKVVECNEPKKCSKCVKSCPAKVLVLKPTGTKKLSDYVKKWYIRPLYKNYCNGCMRCVELCPENCIKIEL